MVIYAPQLLMGLVVILRRLKKPYFIHSEPE